MLKGIKALVAGVVAGTAIGLFFAPKKGHVTRKKIKKEVSGGGSGAKTLKETLGAMGSDIKKTCKTTHKKLSKNEKYRAGTEKVKEYSSKVKQKAGDWIDENLTEEQKEEIKATYIKAKKGVKESITKAKKAYKENRAKSKKTVAKAKKTVSKAKKAVNKTAKKVAKKTSPKKKTTKKTKK